MRTYIGIDNGVSGSIGIIELDGNEIKIIREGKISKKEILELF